MALNDASKNQKSSCFFSPLLGWMEMFHFRSQTTHSNNLFIKVVNNGWKTVLTDTRFLFLPFVPWWVTSEYVEKRCGVDLALVIMMMIMTGKSPLLFQQRRGTIMWARDEKKTGFPGQHVLLKGLGVHTLLIKNEDIMVRQRKLEIFKTCWFVKNV